jgi:hypothetical protein
MPRGALARGNWLPFDRNLLLRMVTLGFLSSFVESGLVAEPPDQPVCLVDVQIDSGILSNPNAEPAVLFSTEIRVPGAASLTLFFQKVTLPPDATDPLGPNFSRIQITSLLDGDSAGMSNFSIKEWGFGSPFFNGDAVRVELVAAPNSEGNQFVINGVLALVDREGRECLRVVFKRGDANSDGKVDIADALAILQRLFLDGDACFCNGDALDANDDGKIDLSDAVRVLGYLFLGTPETLAAPFPECGDDLTDDPLPFCIYKDACEVR